MALEVAQIDLSTVPYPSSVLAHHLAPARLSLLWMSVKLHVLFHILHSLRLPFLLYAFRHVLIPPLRSYQNQLDVFAQWLWTKYR
jgi:hypothetical protein